MTLQDIDTYEAHSQMNTSLITDSEELRVLALLYYADYDRYKNLAHQEKPDLQTVDKRIGVEVTSAVDSNERKASGVFEAYKHGKTKRIKSVPELAAKISEYGSSYLLVDSKKTIAGVGSLGTGEKLQANLTNAIESKVKKAKGYEQFNELDLAVICNYPYSPYTLMLKRRSRTPRVRSSPAPAASAPRSSTSSAACWLSERL